MTPNPVTVTARANIAEVWDLMRDLEIRHVPVVENETVIGMLSDRDLARLNLARTLEVQGVDALRQGLATPAVRVMSSDVIAVEPETELSEVVDLLLEHRVGALPVVLPDSRQIVGIISYIDVLRALQEVLEEQ
jgi:acetoin utilization protein AcuB